MVRLMRHLLRNEDFEISYEKRIKPLDPPVEIVGASDSDWAGDLAMGTPSHPWSSEWLEEPSL